jgi:hypothetical protein
MTLREDSIPTTAPRTSSLLLLGTLATAVVLLAAACGGGADETPTGTSDAPDVVSDDPSSDASVGQEAVVTVYSSPT